MKEEISDSTISVISPFQKKEIVLNLYDKTRLLVGFIFLVPIRLSIIFFSFFLIWVTARIGIIGMDETKPATGIRRFLQKFNYYMARIITWFGFGIFPKISGNVAPVEDAPIVVVAPHTSFFDVWVICWLASLGRCTAIVREENKTTPFLGTVLRFQQMVFVKRSSKTSKRKVVDMICKMTRDKTWGRLVIFPEGTSSNGSCLLPFHKGAFIPGEHFVQPVVVRYPNSVDCTTWTLGNEGGVGALVVALRAMSSLYSKAEMEVLPAVKPEGDALKFGESMRRFMGEKMGLPLYDGDQGRMTSKFK